MKYLNCPHCGTQVVGNTRIVPNLGKRIKLYRSLNNLTQDGLAKKLGCTVMQILRWENGKNKPNRISTQILEKEGII